MAKMKETIVTEWDQAYAAGFLEGLHQAEEAVKLLRCRPSCACPECEIIDHAADAIDDIRELEARP